MAYAIHQLTSLGLQTSVTWGLVAVSLQGPKEKSCSGSLGPSWPRGVHVGCRDSSSRHPSPASPHPPLDFICSPPAVCPSSYLPKRVQTILVCPPTWGRGVVRDACSAAGHQESWGKRPPPHTRVQTLVFGT